MLSPEIEFIKSTIEAEAWQKNYGYVVTEHLLLGLLINSADVKNVLDALAVDTDDLQTRLTDYLDQFVKSATPLSEPPIYTQACERIFRRAVVQLQSSGRETKQVESVDLLVSLMNDKDTYAVQLLLEYGLTRLKLLRHISHQARANTHQKDAESLDEPPVIAVHVKKRKSSPLATYAQNLNKKAEKGKTDPLIGRSAEIERVAHILCRRRKNNPLLVGDPGVGKTAIAEGLAWLIVNQKVAPALQNATIYSLDVGALVAGTKYRGDFEARMKELLDDLKKHPDAILFIDEIHTIIGAGSSMEGNMDMSNLIKPALANGSLRCIGSTTFEEFRQVFEKDHALTRRFQKVDIKEPTIDDSIDILQGLKSHYENFHHVEYSDEAIRAAVELSVKHIHERFLPDKAIDVIDEAGARVRLKALPVPKIPKPTTNLPNQDETSSTAADIASQLDKQIKNPNIKTQILRDLSELMQFIDKTVGLSDKEEGVLPSEQQDDFEVLNDTPRTPIGVKEIEEVIASIARIPPKSVSSDDLATLSTLKDDLKRMVFGQDEAIDKLSDAIILSRAGLKSATKPIGSFMFAGPTGVGKTEIARQLAFTLGIPLIRFDMSEYMEAHTVSRLIGSPPGYVGHDKGGLLTEKIHQSPHAVLLLDELEKAHSDIYNILLQVMDHGTLTDNNGRSVSFRQVILIMTTNVGADSISRNSMGFTKQNHTGDNVEAMKRAFSPEFRNRLDAIVQFAPLGGEAIALVVDKFLIQLQALLDDKNVAMTVSDNARAYLANKGYDPLMGARPMARLIDDEIKKPLAQEILFGRLVDGGQVVIDENEGELLFDIGEMATV